MCLPNLSYDDLLKILLIVILSGMIGYNREKTGMLVGIRTHILVGLSAVLLQIISVKFSELSNYVGDPARLGGQMLTGIGFLGAGSILKDNRNVRGLTTAASIFFVACIGLCIGFGFYFLGILSTLVGYTFLSDILHLKKFINKKRNKHNTHTFQICFETGTHINVKDIVSLLSTLYIDIDTMDLRKDHQNTCIIIKVKSDDEISSTDIMAELVQLNYINSIKEI